MNVPMRLNIADGRGIRADYYRTDDPAIVRALAIAAVVDERAKDRGPRGFFLERDILTEAEARLKADGK